MPGAKKIKEAMAKKGIPGEKISKINFPEGHGSKPSEIMDVVGQMENVLTEEEILSVMEEQGCCKTGKPMEAHRAFGVKHKDKPLAERVKLLHEEKDMIHKAPCRLNDDGTLSVWWSFEQNGKNGCVCGVVNKLPKGDVIPKSFCGCCGGHIRSNYQRSLRTKLRLKKIVSSAVGSNGEKQCEFLFEALE